MAGITTVELDTFYIQRASTPFNAKPLVNVIATLRGGKEPNKVFIIGAHLDASASREKSRWRTDWQTIRAPGADDNASGVAVMLEVARVLCGSVQKISPDYTVKFIAFGAEEFHPAYTGKGHHFGSRHYARKAKQRGEQILGVISIDMIGYNQRYLYVTITSDSSSSWLGQKIIEANQRCALGLTTNTPPFRNSTTSDHASFQEIGFSAITLSESFEPWTSESYYRANPFYHTSQDESKTLNLELVRKVAQVTLAVMVTLASSEIKK
jgi:Zn-dependent M28 family amino/carboxypeptidase